MKTLQEKIQGLDCLSVKGEDSQTAVILLHGYGANMRDLYPLWEIWHKKGFDWFFPNAPLSLSMGFYEGRAWFSIDVEELERSMRDGSLRDLSQKIPPEFDSSLEQLVAFINDLKKNYKKIIIGGFSQGAMCASHLALNSELNVDALILLSGSLIAESRLPHSAREIPFYQSHGILDPILSLSGAKKLEEKLLSLKLKGKLRSFQGVHEIPESTLREVDEFLNYFAQ
jgi:phospholipase/carboxylesterase